VSAIEISLHVIELPSLGNSKGPTFEFPARLTGDIYADFLDAELPNLLEDILFLFCINEHDGAPPPFQSTS
jgi:hypothetical protein